MSVSFTKNHIYINNNAVSMVLDTQSGQLFKKTETLTSRILYEIL